MYVNENTQLEQMTFEYTKMKVIQSGLPYIHNFGFPITTLLQVFRVYFK